MRDIRFVLTVVSVFSVMASCTETAVETVSEAEGNVSVSLSAEERLYLSSKSSPEGEVQVDDFTVEIFKTDGQPGSEGVRLYRDSYANTRGRNIGLNPGNYRLYAYYGAQDGAGFDTPYYKAEKDFEVRPKTHEEVSATASLSNVKVSVAYGDIIKLDYKDFYTVVRSGKEASLRFDKDETRPGYVPAGEVVVEVYADVDGEWKYYASEPVEYQPGDYVILNIDTKPSDSSLSLDIKVDNSVEIVEEEITIPESMMPQSAPEMTFNGFGESGKVEIFEAGEVPESMKVDIVAGAGISHCYLDIQSDCLMSLGVPERVDLTDIDPSVSDILRDNGFRWLGSMSGQRLAYIDLTGLAEKLSSERYDPAAPFRATVTVTVEDAVGKSTESSPVSVASVAPEFSFSAADTDAWARSIRGMEISYGRANPGVLKLQYKSESDTEWKDAALASDNGSVLSYENISGLSPQTEYQLRAIYNGNAESAVTAALTTEDAAQAGNAGFEEWTTEEFKFTYKFFGSHEHNVNWYLPWTSGSQDVWWAVNSRKSMPTSTSVVSANWNWVRFPMVAFTDDSASGNYAARIYTVAVGDWSTEVAPGTSYAGELFIGTSDDSGNHSSDGHSFSSRPDMLQFMYKYDSNGGETFEVYSELRSPDGGVIATASSTGQASGEWSRMTVPFTYSDLDVKAGTVTMSFRSSSSTEPSVTGNKSIVIAGNETYTGNFGSVLTVDDIELIYE